MSLYGATVQQGIAQGVSGYFQALEAGRSAFNTEYANTMRKINLRSQQAKAARNINAIRQDTILSNLELQLRQKQAQAQVMVSAAAAGVEGGSVDDVIYSTQSNEAMAKQRISADAEQRIAQESAQAGSAQSAMMAIEPMKNNNYLGMAIGAVANEFGKEDSLLRENVADLWSK
jgi:hypothetical protein